MTYAKQTWHDLPAGGTPLSADRLQHIEDGIETLENDSQATYVRWESVVNHGAVGDGVADDAAAIQSAIDAVHASGGGIVYFPRGLYRCATPLNADGTTNIVLWGAPHLADRHAVSPVEIQFSSAGAAPQLSARHADGFLSFGVSVTYTSAGYTGRLIDLSGTAIDVTYRPSFRYARCGGIGGVAVNAECIFDLGDAVEPTFEEIVWTAADYGIIGWDGAATFSTQAKLRGGRFVDIGIAAIKNPHQAWVIDGTVFEETISGGPAGIVGEAAYPMLGLTLVGVGLWDDTAVGEWLDLYGDGFTMVGGYARLAPGATFLRMNGTMRGVKVIGTVVDGPADNPPDPDSIFLATANTPVISGAHFEVVLINGVHDNQQDLAGVSYGAVVSADRAAVRQVTANTVLGLADLGKSVFVDASAGAVTITLPDSQLQGAKGARIEIIKTDASANHVSVTIVGGQRIDGGFSRDLTAQGQAMTVRSDGATAPGGWWTVGAA